MVDKILSNDFYEKFQITGSKRDEESNITQALRKMERHQRDARFYH